MTKIFTKLHQTPRWFLYFVGTLLVGFLFIQYDPVTSNATEQTRPNNHNQEILTLLNQDDVVYLGENHDSSEHHEVQLEIILNLNQQNSSMAIALEMFQRPFQPILNRYLAGEISEAELREQTEYDTRWGFDWEYYAPIIRFAQANQIPLLAINTPTEITRKVAISGLASLTGNDFRYIPPLTDIKTDNQDYRALIEQTYLNHSHGGHGNSDGLENFFAAQVLWDETMADAIADFYQTNPESQIVVLVGKGHIVYNYGIPDRVARRITDSSFRQSSVLLGQENTLKSSSQKPIADFIWQF